MNTKSIRASKLMPALAAGLLFNLAPAAHAASPAEMSASSVYGNSHYMESFSKEEKDVQPPWNKPLYEGTQVTVPGLQNVPDIHGDINDPQLVIFFAGNQYMLVNRLMKDFIKANPKYPRVVAFTLPPGRLITATQRGNGILIGNMHVMVKPDILTAGHGSIMNLQKKHHWFAKTENYTRNRLAIMVYKGNPAHITGLKSLSASDLKLCMPNPEWEGIAKHAIIPALKKTGGDALADAVYKEKVKNGTTFLTHIHHRQTPVRIMEQKCTAGVVWYTEAYFHDKIAHHPTSIVTIPDSQNKEVTYAAGMLKKAPHPAAARAFMKFLMTPTAQNLYKEYGFMAPK